MKLFIVSETYLKYAKTRFNYRLRKQLKIIKIKTVFSIQLDLLQNNFISIKILK